MPTLRYLRRIAAIAGLALIAFAVGADVLGVGGSRGFGPLQTLLLAAGSLLLPLAALSGGPLRAYGRLVSLLFFTYASALLCELGLNTALGAPRDPRESLRGWVEAARWGGYELTPGWHGFYDDGRTRAPVHVNSRGDRDDEPERQPPGARLRLLLLGDSQTFGMGLRREETIEGRIEALSGGEVAAYNLGVPGYGPGDSLERYRERADLAATHTFLLLYGNDLRQDNCRSGIHTAFDGFIVVRHGPDGSPLTPEALKKAVAEATREEPLWTPLLKGVLRLEQLRRRLDVLLDTEKTLLAGAPGEFSEECSRAAAREANAMRALARKRGHAFAVVVLPTAGEAAAQQYSKPMQRCLKELARLSIPTLEVRDLLSRGDYLPRDEHLAASGAERVAAAILRAAQTGVGPFPREATGPPGKPGKETKRASG